MRTSSLRGEADGPDASGKLGWGSSWSRVTRHASRPTRHEERSAEASGRPPGAPGATLKRSLGVPDNHPSATPAGHTRPINAAISQTAFPHIVPSSIERLAPLFPRPFDFAQGRPSTPDPRPTKAPTARALRPALFLRITHHLLDLDLVLDLDLLRPTLHAPLHDA